MQSDNKLVQEILDIPDDKCTFDKGQAIAYVLRMQLMNQLYKDIIDGKAKE